MKTMCRCNTIVAFSLKMISFSMKTYSCRLGLNIFSSFRVIIFDLKNDQENGIVWEIILSTKRSLQSDTFLYLLVPRIKNHLSSFELGFLNTFSRQNLLRSLSLILFLLQRYKYGAKKCPKTTFDSTSEMIRL